MACLILDVAAPLKHLCFSPLCHRWNSSNQNLVVYTCSRDFVRVAVQSGAERGNAGRVLVGRVFPWREEASAHASRGRSAQGIAIPRGFRSVASQELAASRPARETFGRGVCALGGGRGQGAVDGTRDSPVLGCACLGVPQTLWTESTFLPSLASDSRVGLVLRR